jgi:phage recombination protein Bet
MIQGDCQKCSDRGETHGPRCIVRKLIFDRDFKGRAPSYVSREKALDAAICAIEEHIHKQKNKDNNMTELTVKNENVSLEERFGYTAEQMEYIRTKVCKHATDAELTQFFYRCSVLKLDPLMPGQIYFLKFKKRNPKSGEDPYSPGSIVIGVDGFRNLASRTGQLSGIKRGVIRDAKGICIGGWADVFRKDWDHPAHLEVSLKEYADPWKETWKDMPESMIQKVAEVAALRMAFPEALGGIYSHEEMDQARRKERDVKSTVEKTTLLPEEPKLIESKTVIPPRQQQILDDEGEEEDVVCCGKKMLVSKFADKATGEFPLYCPSCKAKHYRSPLNEKKIESSQPEELNEDQDAIEFKEKPAAESISNEVPWAKYRESKPF